MARGLLAAQARSGVGGWRAAGRERRAREGGPGRRRDAKADAAEHHARGARRERARRRAAGRERRARFSCFRCEKGSSYNARATGLSHVRTRRNGATPPLATSGARSPTPPPPHHKTNKRSTLRQVLARGYARRRSPRRRPPPPRQGRRPSPGAWPGGVAVKVNRPSQRRCASPSCRCPRGPEPSQSSGPSRSRAASRHARRSPA